TNFGRSLGLARRATDRWHAPPLRGCPAWCPTSTARTEDGRLGTSVGGGTHLHAFDEGGEHPRLADVLGRGREQVAIENDEIGGLPDLERSGVSLAMVQRGPLDRVGPEQRIDRATRAAPGGSRPKRRGLHRFSADVLADNLAHVAPPVARDRYPRTGVQPRRPHPRFRAAWRTGTGRGRPVVAGGRAMSIAPPHPPGRPSCSAPPAASPSPP